MQHDSFRRGYKKKERSPTEHQQLGNSVLSFVRRKTQREIGFSTYAIGINEGLLTVEEALLVFSPLNIV